MSKYVWTEDMGEISGFGGAYEATCQAMVRAGIEWMEAHPEAHPKFHGYKDIYGVLAEDNADAKALTEAMIAASGGDCTGAMHQATVSHLLFIHRNGWEKYCSELRDREKKEASA